MNDITVIGGTASKDLAKKIAHRLKAQYFGVDYKIFPDGEKKLTINGKIKTKKIVVVQSTYPPVDSNFVEILCLLHKARFISKQVYAVIPYLGYARQDKEFLPGEIVTSSVIASLVDSLDVKKILVIDIHSKLVLKYFKTPIINLTAIPYIANYFKNLKLKNPMAVSVDLFWESNTKNLAKILGIESLAINKKRDRKTGNLSIIGNNLEVVKNRDIILVDDMISSGNSMIKAAKILKKNGCRKIFAGCTHALLVNDAAKKLVHAGIHSILFTNTIPTKSGFLDISELIVKSLNS